MVGEDGDRDAIEKRRTGWGPGANGAGAGGFAAEVEFKGHFDGDGIDAPAAGDGAGFEGGAGEAGSWISEMWAMARPMA
jgi:hypothetical protein